MSVEDQSVYTCDRCGKTAIVDAHKRDGERNGPPVDWRHIETRGDRNKSGDLCGVCSDDFYGWWARYGEPRP